LYSIIFVIIYLFAGGGAIFAGQAGGGSGRKRPCSSFATSLYLKYR